MNAITRLALLRNSKVCGVVQKRSESVSLCGWPDENINNARGKITREKLTGNSMHQLCVCVKVCELSAMCIKSLKSK